MKSPAIAAMLALPENQELFKEFVGIEGFEVPGASADLQQRREMRSCCKSGPSMPSPEEVKQAIIQMAKKAALMVQQGARRPRLQSGTGYSVSHASHGPD